MSTGRWPQDSQESAFPFLVQLVAPDVEREV